jgi:hypothetical protein
MQHVGTEQLGQQGGGSVSVYNTTSLSSNPVWPPTTCTHTHAHTQHARTRVHAPVHTLATITTVNLGLA